MRRMEYGALSPNGLLELGGDPARPDPGARPAMPPMPCRPPPTFWPARMWGRCCWKWKTIPRCLDLVASRRLAFAAQRKRRHRGRCCAMARMPQASAALTRWQVASAPSHADDDDWGARCSTPSWCATAPGGLGNFCCTGILNMAVSTAADPGAVAAAPADRPADPQSAVAALKRRWSSAARRNNALVCPGAGSPRRKAGAL